MSLILHIVIIASYFVLATAVALVAPALVPSLTADLAPLAAVIVFVACAVAHLVFAQSERNRRLVGELSLVRRQTREIAEDLRNTQTQALQMRQVIDQAGRAGEQRVSEVVSEVKVLQGLIEACSRKQAESALSGEVELAERPLLVAVEGGKAVSAVGRRSGECQRPGGDRHRSRGAASRPGRCLSPADRQPAPAQEPLL